MSNDQKTEETTAEVEAEEEPFVPVPLDKLAGFMTHTEVPVFIANIANICDHVEAAGIDMYYVVSYGKEESKTGVTTKTKLVPTIWFVNKTIISRVVVPADPEDIALDIIEPEAQFSLPKIPRLLVDKMDQFFRTVDHMYSTEAILLLTYDTTKTGPDGWGVLVPDQTNTGAACDFVPESVAAEKPDHVYIVGSAHSHPGMAAYASGTDHGDQAEFDGLHVTFGWLAKNNNMTEYYAELQMSGISYKIGIDHIFESPMPVEVDDEVMAWTEKVKKKTHTTTPGNGAVPLAQSQSHGQSGTKTTGTGQGTSKGSTQTKLSVGADLPDGAPSAEDNIIIGVIDEKETFCPFCATKLTDEDLNKRRCLSCHFYIAFPNENLMDIIAIRTQSKSFTYDIDITGPGANSDIYFWTRPSGDQKKHTFELVYSASGDDEGK